MIGMLLVGSVTVYRFYFCLFKLALFFLLPGGGPLVMTLRGNEVIWKPPSLHLSKTFGVWICVLLIVNVSYSCINTAKFWNHPSYLIVFFKDFHFSGLVVSLLGTKFDYSAVLTKIFIRNFLLYYLLTEAPVKLFTKGDRIAQW